MRIPLVASQGVLLSFLLCSLLGTDIHAQRGTGSAPRLEIVPPRTLHAEPVTIRVLGLKPDEQVTLQADMTNYGGATWRSSATYRANPDGIVDLTGQAPVAGSYGDVDAMGLFWSMVRLTDSASGDQDGGEPPQFSGEVQPGEPVLVTVTAKAAGRPQVQSTAERLFVGHDFTRHSIRDQRMVGTLFVPPGPGPHPAIIVPNGGVCSPPEQLAASIAAHGFVALALQYCGAEGLPRNVFAETPLEYFGQAIQWLQQRPGVAPDGIGMVGVSGGGLVALEVAAHYPDIHAVVAIKSGGVNVFNFTHQGVPVPKVGGVQLPSVLQDDVRYQQPEQCKPASDPPRWSCFNTTLRILYRYAFNAFDSTARFSDGITAVERINGPVLLISGTGDLAWPATLFSEISDQRLTRHKFRFAHEHVVFDGAGHRLGVPNLPRTDEQLGVQLLGGTAKDAAAANVAYWPRMIEFLQTHLSR